MASNVKKTKKRTLQERALRATAWGVAWVALYFALSDPTAPGGIHLGLILGGTTMIVLRATK